ncbi:hypothetical protein A2U01_0028051, partial [Trifolium medium]|nr:hypothetical protein [Trifolium medium]
VPEEQNDDAVEDEVGADANEGRMILVLSHTVNFQSKLFGILSNAGQEAMKQSDNFVAQVKK